MARLFVAAALVCLLSSPAVPANFDATAINNAEFRGKLPAEDKADAGIVKVQILLDRALFSPGEIDGKLAENTQKALRAFADAKSLTFQKTITPELWTTLTQTGQDPVITQYTIAAGDVKGPFLKKLPAKMEAMKDLKALSYTSSQEAIAEKFHMSEALLSALNPGKKFDRAGDTIFVANVLDRPGKVTIGRVEVDKSRQAVRAFDPQGALVGVFPATVGSEEKPTPGGTLKVVSVDANPTYRYNPQYKFKGVRSKRPFTINPGPNNPVGVYWIGLSAEGYGIHGTPNPGKISKSESHGCVRLTNWDATWLAGNIKKGTPVEFVEGVPSDRNAQR
ncbi:L,D-transpeptidase [Bradyrhizobium sp. Ash2021]|uniref:L,D-transpeptidase family protein n=1 Tax=Bradyrhizobium sp. Ash2021 TaxID=2954771 RepID=UPI002814E9A4|nr:L,D-transpeptidase [Bradyrhizobium sp. Ash2021]WMT73274.1 L,D-transpeptidase [Bradyrhizobium sp. Ash2021]